MSEAGYLQAGVETVVDHVDIVVSSDSEID